MLKIKSALLRGVLTGVIVYSSVPYPKSQIRSMNEEINLQTLIPYGTELKFKENASEKNKKIKDEFYEEHPEVTSEDEETLIEDN